VANRAKCLGRVLVLACSWPPVTPKALSRSKLALKIEFTRFALSLEREHPVEVNKVTSVE
jgi:hypothetical protein